jgi:hypothetical protein
MILIDISLWLLSLLRPGSLYYGQQTFNKDKSHKEISIKIINTDYKTGFICGEI